MAFAAAATAVAVGATAGTLYIYDDYGNLRRVTDTAVDPQNCGAKDVVCVSAGEHVIPFCGGGKCTPGPCESGFGDCDGNKLTNGCETSITTTADCGACNNVCATVPNGSPTCSDGTCGIACNRSFTLCSGSCVALDSDPENCGGCGNHCDYACSGGGCTMDYCPGEYCGGCDSGCEWACGELGYTSSSCVSNACCCYNGSPVSECPAGQTLCSGLCVDLAYDQMNCGSCGNVCSYGCAGGACTILDYCPGEFFGLCDSMCDWACGEIGYSKSTCIGANCCCY